MKNRPDSRPSRAEFRPVQLGDSLRPSPIPRRPRIALGHSRESTHASSFLALIPFSARRRHPSARRHRRRRATPPSLTTTDAGGRVSPGFSLNDTGRAPLSQEWTRKRGRRGGGEGEREEFGFHYEG
ncbi:hypothetical protein VPH35_126865 [Triticum aestivum]